MKIEDIKVGMKVVPFQKTASDYSIHYERNYKHFLFEKRHRPGVKFFLKNGYFLINGIERIGILLGSDNDSGDYYNVDDFILYNFAINKQYQLGF